jgi:hypothetical protein
MVEAYLENISKNKLYCNSKIYVGQNGDSLENILRINKDLNKQIECLKWRQCGAHIENNLYQN